MKVQKIDIVYSPNKIDIIYHLITDSYFDVDVPNVVLGQHLESTIGTYVNIVIFANTPPTHPIKRE